MADFSRPPMPDGQPTYAPVREPQLPRFTGWLRPAVDAVARIKSSIHRKLLFGFLTGALLLVAMAVLSLLVIGRMDERMDVLNAQAVKVSRARQMLYDVTAQSHFRAMALLLHKQQPDVASNFNAKVEAAKKDFTSLLQKMRRDDPTNDDFYRRLQVANRAYSGASARVLAAYQAGEYGRATKLHLTREHPDSHVLEDLLANCPTTDNPCFARFGRPFIDVATQQMTNARQAFRSDSTTLRNIVIGFSAVSVIVALLLGFLLSWTFILPVLKMQGALARITSGNFNERVQVPNRDEFGRLTRDLNSTSERLAQLFESQRSLTDHLSESNASLARASEAKSRFLASVSHELRTPMNAILGFTDALLAGVDGPLNQEQKESLGWVQRGGRDLLGLINEILDLSKIEAGKLTLDIQAFDPGELIAAVVEQQRSLAVQKGIRFSWRDTGAPSQVVLDRQRVGQILVNLLGNALKYTRDGEVAVEADGAADALLRVTVRDSGPGIAPDQHEAIFEEFRQASGDPTGSGLGLAISRRLARAMGGDISVESELGHGSTFSLVLPLDCRASSMVPASPEHDAVAEGTVLLLSVDDDPSFALLLQKLLAGSGYRVVASKSPQETVNEARQLQPAAILLDLLMPERNGEEVLSDLKNDPATSRIPVIVVSVIDSADAVNGADAHLSKPVSKDALLRVLSEHLPGKGNLPGKVTP